MILINEFLEILFYLGVTLIVELIVLLGLGYFNKKFLVLLLIINIIIYPIYGSLLAIYSYVFNNEISIVLVLLLEVFIIAIEFYLIFKHLKNQYSKVEILITVILINGISFLLIEFIKYTFSYLKVFPLF